LLTVNTDLTKGNYKEKLTKNFNYSLPGSGEFSLPVIFEILLGLKFIKPVFKVGVIFSVAHTDISHTTALSSVGVHVVSHLTTTRLPSWIL